MDRTRSLSRLFLSLSSHFLIEQVFCENTMSETGVKVLGTDRRAREKIRGGKKSKVELRMSTKRRLEEVQTRTE